MFRIKPGQWTNSTCCVVCTICIMFFDCVKSRLCFLSVCVALQKICVVFLHRVDMLFARASRETHKKKLDQINLEVKNVNVKLSEGWRVVCNPLRSTNGSLDVGPST